MTERKEKFTPGPWHIRKPRKGHRICHSVLDKNGDGIAITVCRRHNGERVANDHLIEAGPDMYYALKCIFESSFCINMSSSNIERAISALKKARGEE